ncbi:MAG: DUF1538 domain-containing protein [Candidatus Methylomirabilales bacterium]
MNTVRFADYQRAAWWSRRTEISFNDISEVAARDPDGNLIPVTAVPLKLTLIEAARLVQPYVSVRFMEQVRAVVPLAVYLVLFKLLILDHVVADSWIVSGGLFAVIVGLMFFMEGLKLGLMPLGNLIGNSLPRRSSLPLVLLVALLLGVGVTFAEPAIGALKVAGANVSVQAAPYLFALLNEWTETLVLVVGLAVGLAAVVGTLRFIYGWSLKPLIYLTLAPTLLLTLYAAGDPELTKALGLAWDTGAVTTGPVTVPLVLSLGIGIAAAAGKGETGLSGFGIVTLASLLPVIGVLILALYVVQTATPAEIIAAASRAVEAPPSAWYETSPGVEIVLGIRAILPLVLFLLLVQKVLVRERLQDPGEMIYGIGLAMLGMCIFNVGLTFGLSKLGGEAGGLIPSAFTEIEGAPDSPIYPYAMGLTIAIVFAWILGFGATIAEPALNALGVTTAELTNGVFEKKTLIYAVSTGVAFGIAAGLCKLIFDVPLVWLIVPGYLAAIVLTFISSETFVNVAWDSAGVTTGPITVPLVLAMGLGIGNATDAVEGFGILCMASIGPIITVMLSGLWARYKIWTQTRAAARAPAVPPEREVLAEV